MVLRKLSSCLIDVTSTKIHRPLVAYNIAYTSDTSRTPRSNVGVLQSDNVHMKQTLPLTGAQPEPVLPPHDKKRKRPSHSNVQADKDPSHKQQNIHNIFSSQSKPSVGSKLTTPDKKRIKTDTLSPASSITLPRENMYTFTSKQSNGTLVDLTNSPPRNGLSRKLAGVKPASNINPHQGAKKLVVKNLKKDTSWDPQRYLDQIWVGLETVLDKIFSGQTTGFSMEDSYRSVENVCRQGKAKAIYERLDQAVKLHLKDHVCSSLLQKSAGNNSATLAAVLGAWNAWKSQMTTIRGIFFYMDRSYLLQQSQTSLHEVCTNHFRNIIFNNEALKPKTVDGACELISADRMEQDMDKSTLRSAISMFHDLATYTSAFEPRLLAISQTYAVNWADERTSEESLPVYVKAADQVMTREVSRCEIFGLDTSTRRDLLEMLEANLVQTRVDFLTAQKDVSALLDANAVPDLAKLYKLLERKKLGHKLKAPFSKWVLDTGTSIVFDDKASEEMVVRLLSLKRRLDNIWNVSFQRNMELGHGLRESFESFINKTKKGESTWGTDNSKTGEMIAKYVDMLLKGGSKVIPTELTVTKKDANEQEDEDDRAADEDTEVNAQLDQVLDLFRFVHGKAVFEAFYKKDLAKRLLMGRSASADSERSMLARLKTECGSGFTQNLEQMFRDVELGREEMSSYKDRLENMEQKPGAIDLNVNVLSAAAWPTYPEVPVVIPAAVKAAIDDFERHYKGKHSGRKLAWKHALASCQMKATFPKGPKEFVVSAFQAIILLLFNGLGKDDHLTYDYIKTESGLSEAEVKRTLQSLACAKLRPIRKEPQGKDINEDDKFSINQAFSHPKYRVRINQVQLKETKQENKETHERVAEDRNFECQAAIVRIMKSRKTIGHSELVAEVITATRSRGVLAVSDIKKNIDRLIEKDYMERDEGNTYNYVA